MQTQEKAVSISPRGIAIEMLALAGQALVAGSAGAIVAGLLVVALVSVAP